MVGVKFDSALMEELRMMPVNRMTEFGDATVALVLQEKGAELRFLLQEKGSADWQNLLLRKGFSIALKGPTGIAIDPDEGHLLLIEWLPLARTWQDAAEALEAMFNLRDTYRPTHVSGPRIKSKMAQWSRDEVRFRASVRNSS